MGWWAMRPPLAAGRIAQQNAPWSTVALGGQVEGRATARPHAASLLASDQRRTPAIARDQLVEIGAHQGAAAAALGSNEDLQPLHPADARCPAWPQGNDPGGVCHDRKDSEVLACASSSTSEKSAMPFLIPRSEEHTSELQSLMRTSY